MSVDDAHLAQSRREPLWAIGLSILLIAVGLAPRPASPDTGGGNRATLDDLGSAGFMVELASIAHETQYTRLFRS